MATIEDVARSAGVSISTVSNLLNGRVERMGRDTRTRVEQAIAALGFQPSRAARLLKTGHTPMLGLLVPSIANPLYGALARAIETAAQTNHRYRVVLGNTYRDPAQEASFFDDLLSHGVRGVILVSSLAEEEHLRTAIDRGLVAVSYDRRQSPGDTLRADHVSVDNVEAGRLAAAHLLGLGHRHLAFAMPSGMTTSRRAKIDGINAAVPRSGGTAEVVAGPAAHDYGDTDMAELGRDLAGEIARLRPRPTAVIAVNDLLAIGLIAGLRDHGLQVPADMSVVGFEDIFLSSLIRPTLTSVRFPIAEMAAVMVERLVQRLADSSIPVSEFLYQPALVARESSGPVAD